MGERELHHLHAARYWAAGNWEAATRSLERALCVIRATCSP